MRKRKRVWAAVSLITAIALVNFVVILLAGTQGTPCSPSDTENVRLWENAQGDTSDGNDSIWLCGHSYSNLYDIAHTLPGDCHGSGVFGRSDWGDCTNSASVRVPNGERLCIYSGSGYSGLVLLNKQGPQVGGRYDYTADDAASLKFTSASC